MLLLKSNNYLRAALKRTSGQLCSREQSLIEEVILGADQVNAYKAITHAPETLSRNIFLKLTPKTIEPQILYGSLVPSQTINELSICGAKVLDGKWVADEQNILARLAMPERTMSSLIFGRNKVEGVPATFTELQGDRLPKHQPRTSIGENYFGLADDVRADVKADSEALGSLVEKVRTGEIKLNKELVKQISYYAIAISGYARSDLRMELANMASKAEESVYHLRSEALATISSTIANIAEHAHLEHKEELLPHEKSAFSHFYTLNQSLSHREALVRMIELDSNCKESDKVTKNELIGALSNTVQFRDGSNHCINQAMLSLSNPCGTVKGLFGDERAVHDYFTLSISFGHDRISESTYAPHYNSDANLMQITLSEYQLMALLQTSFADVWVKGTMTRLLQECLPFDVQTEDKQAKRNYKAATTDQDQKAIEIQKQISELTSSTLRTNADKQKLIQLAAEMVSLTDQVLAGKLKALEESAEELFSDYENETRDFLNSALEKAGAGLTPTAIKLLKALSLN